jgi:hypothetical protein
VCTRVRAVDRDGNASAFTSQRCQSAPLSVTSLSRGSGWALGRSRSVYSGYYAASVRAGAVLSVAHVTGARLAVLANAGPRAGTISVYLGKRLVATLPLSRSRASAMTYLLPARAMSNATVSIRVTAPGKKGVVVTGLAVLR